MQDQATREADSVDEIRPTEPACGYQTQKPKWTTYFEPHLQLVNHGIAPVLQQLQARTQLVRSKLWRQWRVVQAALHPYTQKVRAVVGDLGKMAPPAARSLWRWTRASGGAAHPHRAWLLLLLATAAYAVVALPHIFAARLPEFNDHELPNTRSVGRGRGSSKGTSLPGRRGGRHATPATRTSLRGAAASASVHSHVPKERAAVKEGVLRGGEGARQKATDATPMARSSAGTKVGVGPVRRMQINQLLQNQLSAMEDIDNGGGWNAPEGTPAARVQMMTREHNKQELKDRARDYAVVTAELSEPDMMRLRNRDTEAAVADRLLQMRDKKSASGQKIVSGMTLLNTKQ
mmetsp:Transcript_37269/g.70016  ORF Transcript_37269/g.70016 Transcript_37269/m.70016 type:complete len:347 (+) Transcript_37269:82-1122(+)